MLATCVSTWAAGVPDEDRGHGGEGQCLPQRENDSCRLLCICVIYCDVLGPFFFSPL